MYLTVHCVTAVLEQALLCWERLTKRYFGSSELQCLCVYPGYRFKMDMCTDAEQNTQAWIVSVDVSGE